MALPVGFIRDKDTIVPTGRKNKGRPQTDEHRQAIADSLRDYLETRYGKVLIGEEISTGFRRLFISCA